MTLSDIVPPFISKFYIRNLKPYGWFGDYKTWDEAVARSVGYDSNLILNRVDEAMEYVLSNKAAYEKDGVLFKEPDFNWPVLSNILLAANQLKKLSVLDFGGALGSFYFQHQLFLSQIDCVWNVVEQQNFVDLGKKKYEHTNLKFHYKSEDVFEPNVLMIACVLQYLPNPYETLETILKRDFSYIILDRLALTNKDKTRLTIQKVSPKIYPASYPAWFLSETRIQSLLEKNYERVCKYECTDKPNIDGHFTGLVYKRK